MPLSAEGLEAVQAQAGHLSTESIRVYLHLTNDWLAGEYRRRRTDRRRHGRGRRDAGHARDGGPVSALPAAGR